MERKEKNIKLLIRRIIVVIIAIALLALIIWGISKIISAIFSKEKVYGNLVNKGLVIADGNKIYYNKYDEGIYKVGSKDDEEIVAGKAYSLTIYKDKIYYLTISNTGTIDLLSVDLKSKEQQKIKSLSTSLDKFYIEDGYVFYSKIGDGVRGIVKLSLDVGEETIVVANNIRDFVVENGKIFYVDNVGFLRSTDTSGQNGKDISTKYNIGKIQIAKKWIYFYDSNEDALCKMKKDGSSDSVVTTLVKNDTFNVTSKYIYYFDSENNQICRCNLKGKSQKAIVSVATPLTRINIVNNVLYYLDKRDEDNGQYRMYRVKTNGKAAKDIIY